jgi:putative ABC transport system ATP-binding protein
VIRLLGIERSFRAGPTTIDVLRGLDLVVEPGERVAIMGASGSGKSTLLHLLALLDRPSAGSYRLEGREVTQLDDDALSRLRNRRIGIVFQAFHLLPRETVADNVALRLLYRGVDPAAAGESARQALSRVRLEERADSRAADLSGGQQQRVAIARALVDRPAVLLADEPTGSLDRRTADEVLDLIVELTRSAGLTTVLATHDPAVAARCDRVLSLAGGVLAPLERSA